MTKAARATASEPDAEARSRSIERAIAGVQRRVRCQRAANAASVGGALALTALGPLLLYSKLHATDRVVPYWVSGTCVVALSCMAALLASLRGVPSLQAAQLIDRSHQLSDLIASGWSFAQQPIEQRTPFMQTTLERAALRCESIEFWRAWAWRWPSSLLLWPFLACGLAFVAWFQPTPSAAAASVRRTPARLLPRDEVAAELRYLARSSVDADDASLRDATRELERLLALVAQQGIDRVGLLRAFDVLESRLAQASQHSADQQGALRELGHALAGATITQQLSAALASGDLVAGRVALQKLARSVASATDPRALDRLRAALRSALAKRQQTRHARITEARSALESSLKKHSDDAAADVEAQRAAKRQLDELLREERAERQAARDRAAKNAGQASGQEAPRQATRERQLDRLERQLGDAAHGGNDAEQTARDMQGAADTMQRMQRSSDHDRALERLQERVAELRQRLAESQSSQAASDRPQPAGNEHEPEKPLTLGQFQRLARGEPAQKDSSKPNEAPSPASAGTLVRDDSARNPPPSAAGQASVLERRIGSPENAPSSEGRVQTGAPTHSESATKDVALAGVTGRGPSRSSVIYDAAARGFGTRAYEKVHADYREHAESEIEREALPVGYRVYVHRYFELIQPREDAHD